MKNPFSNKGKPRWENRKKKWCLTCQIDVHHKGMSRRNCFCPCWREGIECRS